MAIGYKNLENDKQEEQKAGDFSPVETAEKPLQETLEEQRRSAQLNEFIQDAGTVFKQIGKELESRTSLKGFSTATLGAGFIDFLAIVGGETSQENKGKEKQAEKLELKNQEETRPSTRAELSDLALKLYKDDRRLEPFMKALEAFEGRAETDKISKEEREKFYGQVKDVLEASKSGNTNFTAEQLRDLGRDMMLEAADPGIANQGGYGTCTAASLQAALFKAEPATIGGLIRDLALNGDYKTEDGSQIVPNSKNLHNDKYQDAKSPYARNSVDQLAQVGLLNIFWQRRAGLEGAEPALKGKIKYEEGHPRDHLGDDRTRLMNYADSKPKSLSAIEEIFDPGRKLKEGTALFSTTVERPLSGPRILDMANVKDIYDQLRGNHKNLKVISANGSAPVFKPQSKEELVKFLENAKKENGGVLPATVIGVYTHIEPFKQDLKDAFYRKDESSSAKDTAVHAHHAVSLFDFDSMKDHAILENQWGHNVDHTGKAGSKPPVALEDLFKSIKGEEPELSRDKPEPREKTEEKAPSSEERASKYIAAYKDMLTELHNDRDADPAKVFEHEKQLLSYFEDWGKKNEHAVLLEKTVETFSKLLASEPTTLSHDDLRRSYELLAPHMKDKYAPELKLAAEVLSRETRSKIDSLEKFSTRDFKELKETLDSISHSTRAFEENGQTGLSSDLTRDLIAKVDSARNSKGLTNNSLNLTENVLDCLKNSGKNAEAEALFKRTVAAAREISIDNLSDLGRRVDLSMELVHLAKRMDAKDTKASLFKELEEIHGQLSKDLPLGSELRSNLRFHMIDEYIQRRDGEKLEPLVKEWFQNAKNKIAERSKISDIDNSPAIAAPLRRAGELLSSAGLYEKALPYFAKSLELSRSIKERDIDNETRTAEPLITALLKLNKTEEAEKLAKQYDLEIMLRRRR
ncbi:MAG: tetratricopeptide repeat protein [Candidatus Obscuribacterales bacterium]|nr:tetratricopeptide repeat protein [Candidatus Obscuribacterales bacterium]